MGKARLPPMHRYNDGGKAVIGFARMPAWTSLP
jgi:hypothetical protein